LVVAKSVVEGPGAGAAVSLLSLNLPEIDSPVFDVPAREQE
jgi:hypothetical protein